MIVESTTELPQDTDADTAVIGVLDGEKIHHDIDGILNGLVAAGEAKAKHRHVAVVHAAGKRWVLVGLGKRDELDPEKVRVAAAAALNRARELGTKRLCWEVPHKVGSEIAAAIVEGTMLTGYRFDRFKSKPAEDNGGLDALLVSAHDDLSAVVAEAEIVARAVNAARNLQNTPANAMTPTAVADAARVLGELDGVTVEVEGRDGLERLGMGSFACVAQGSSRGARAHHAQLRRAGREGPGARPRRQGRHVRHRRHLDQDRQQDVGHEVRHVRRRGGARRDRGDRRAAAADPRRGGRRRDREHAGRQRRQARRRRHAPPTARRSRSSTPTPRAASCWPTA